MKDFFVPKTPNFHAGWTHPSLNSRTPASCISSATIQRDAPAPCLSSRACLTYNGVGCDAHHVAWGSNCLSFVWIFRQNLTRIIAIPNWYLFRNKIGPTGCFGEDSFVLFWFGFIYLYVFLSLPHLRNFGRAWDHGYGAKLEKECHQQNLSYY